MPGRVVRADDRHRALEERRLEELTQERDHWALSHRLVCAELAEYEAALRALVAGDPIVRYGGADFGCWFCETDASLWAVRPEQVEHSDDCAWVRARALLEGEGEE
jgi:hypothetical protein